MSSAKDYEVKGWVRPLSLPSISVAPCEEPIDTINPELLLKDISHDYSDQFLEQVKHRYLLLSTEDLDIFLVPAENLILEKIVWPLRSAKTAFLLSDFLACIALCGMVSEMAVIFICDLARSSWDLSRLPAEDAKLFKERKYEKLRQEERIGLLKRSRAISSPFASDAHYVRKIRNQYLHVLNKDYSNIKEDASGSYKRAFRLVKPLVELPLGERGKMRIPAHLQHYLESKGIASPIEG